jgi:hypothetical protein
MGLLESATALNNPEIKPYFLLEFAAEEYAKRPIKKNTCFCREKAGLI